MMVAIVLVATIVKMFCCRKVIVFMCAFEEPVKYGAVRVVENVGDFLVFMNCLQCKAVIVVDVIMYVFLNCV
jgi:hypothetical protein